MTPITPDNAFLIDFHHVATIGATPANGVERQAATPDDKRTRDWFVNWAEENGFRIEKDAVGNLFALLEWTPGAPSILIGSHLDSQPLAGRFDGAYGVLAALHVARDINERVIASGQPPLYNLAVVNWFNEEGSRFAPSVMGSSVFAGIYGGPEMLAVTDPDGVSVRDALDAIGYLGTGNPGEVAGYAEIHIEQGRILEREGIDIGVVEKSWYTQKLDIEVVGEQSHTGATAMADRRDALVGASRIVLLVNDVVREFAEEAMVSSVGKFDVEPNSPIVVPRWVHLVADIRSGDPEIVAAARAWLVERIDAVAAEQNLDIRVRDFDVRPIRRFPQAGLELAEAAAARVGLSSRRISTMAGHDSVAMNTVVPSVMLFVPSVDGVSHCEREFTTDDDMLRGLHALREVTLDLLGGALPPARVVVDQASDTHTPAGAVAVSAP